MWADLIKNNTGAFSVFQIEFNISVCIQLMDHFLPVVKSTVKNRKKQLTICYIISQTMSSLSNITVGGVFSLKCRICDDLWKKGGILSEKILGVVSNVMNVMNGHPMKTGVCTDHCNYGALGESSFLCRFICHINKGISSMYGG